MLSAAEASTLKDWRRARWWPRYPRFGLTITNLRGSVREREVASSLDGSWCTGFHIYTTRVYSYLLSIHTWTHLNWWSILCSDNLRWALFEEGLEAADLSLNLRFVHVRAHHLKVAKIARKEDLRLLYNRFDILELVQNKSTSAIDELHPQLLSRTLRLRIQLRYEKGKHCGDLTSATPNERVWRRSRGVVLLTQFEVPYILQRRVMKAKTCMITSYKLEFWSNIGSRWAWRGLTCSMLTLITFS